MFRFGVRLAVAGGREAVARLALIAIAVGIGVGLLLTAVASIHAVEEQNSRYAWLQSGFAGAATPGATEDALWWSLQTDYFQGDRIARVDLAGTGPDSPVPPGIGALPGAGEFYASPALAKLLQDTPRAELGVRYPGSQIGTLGAEALPAPNSMVIVVGHSVADLSQEPNAHQIAAISTTSPSQCVGGGCLIDVGIDPRGMTLIMSVVAAALVFPVLIFIGNATRLSAARREQRFAAMRLVGATPRQISILSAVESAVAAVLGVLLGFGLFYAFRPALAKIPFTGDPFFTTDLSVGPVQILVIALGIPLAAAVAARIALRRVNLSPLGVTRRVTPTPPRRWRLVPLLAGIVELTFFAYFTDIGDPDRYSGPEQAYAYLGGILLIMAGLVIAGPWLTLLGSRVLARRATRPAGLIAGRRLGDNPQASFRAVSGLVLAVFVGTLTAGTITTITASDGGPSDDPTDSAATVVRDFRGHEQDRVFTELPSDVRATLTKIGGVTGVATIHATPGSESGPDAIPARISCAELAGVPAFGRCADGAEIARITPHFGGGVIDRTTMADTTWPDARLTNAELQAMPVETIVVGTDGSAAAVEEARSVLEAEFPLPFPPMTLAEYKDNNERQLAGYQRLADVILLTSLPIAGCSLAVSVVGGLAERKRPFSLLRLAGTPLAVLRRVVALEAAAPLLITAIASAGAGLLAAHLFVHAQLGEPLRPPGLAYFLLLALALLASLAVIISALPVLKRITGPETARND